MKIAKFTEKEAQQLLTTKDGLTALVRAYGERSWKRGYKRLCDMAAEGADLWVTPGIYGKIARQLGWRKKEAQPKKCRKAPCRGKAGQVASLSINAKCNGRDVSEELSQLIQTTTALMAETIALLRACGIDVHC